MTINDQLRAFRQSTRHINWLYVLCALLVLAAAFTAGMSVGYHRAAFASRWGESYSRTFGGPGPFGLDKRMPMPHGTSGTIVSLASSTMVIAGKNEPEQSVLLASDTIIRNGTETVTASALTPGVSVTVLGNPDSEGHIIARFIRIIPTSASSTSQLP